jgi:hypothetical protein
MNPKGTDPMNTRIRMMILMAGLCTGTVFAQGPLTPPGAPGATMKTLVQIEPRIPITNVPYTITQPGSYYLATNLTSAGSGVTIATNAVNLDLMGFTLAGNRFAGDHGILLSGASGTLPVRDVVVRNGSLRGFSYGIQAKFGQGARFEDLSISSNLSYGINLDGMGGQCNGNAIIHCSLTANGSPAIRLYGPGGQCNGNRIVQCAISGNNDDGIQFNADSSGQCNGNILSDCEIQGNGDYGIYGESGTGKCNGNLIARCAINGNTDDGILLDGTSGQCSGNAITDCRLSGNGGYGIALDGNAGQSDGNAIVGCTVGDSVDAEILLNVAGGNRVEGNHVFDYGAGTRYGIDGNVSTNNFILCNSSMGQTYNFFMNAKDVYGPSVTNAGELATSGASAQPWANFER